MAALEDHNLCKSISQLAIAGKESEKALRARARKYLQDIAADYNGQWLNIWDRILTSLWQVLYDAFVVDQEGMVIIQEITRRMPCVIIPCHRSHVDYLILSHLFYKQKMPLPHIAAGDNMNFWPLGYIFRHSGAFFLRRSFRGDDLYREVFTAYLKCLLQQGTLIEFFLEGGRSRTGKMLVPKYGILSMIMRSYQDGIGDDLALIPVYLGYDRIIEENSYLKELRGAKKKTESVSDLLKSTTIMRRRYGNVYVNIGTPIFLKSYLEEQPQPFTDMTVNEQQALYRNIGAKVISEINRVSVVTPIALAAVSLLCFAGKEVAMDMLMSTFAVFYDYLRSREVNFSPHMTKAEETILPVLALLKQWGLLACQNQADGNRGRYSIPEEKRLHLEYYKNNIMHHLLPVCFVSLSILSRQEKATIALIREDCLFLKNLLREEFSWEEGADSEVEEVLSYLEESGLIICGEGRVACQKKEARRTLEAFAGLLGSWLEAYGVVLKAFSLPEKAWTTGRDLPDELLCLAEGMYGKAIISRAESLSREYYKNALNLLRHEGIISKWEDRQEETEHDVVRINDEERLAGLSDRLTKLIEPTKVLHCLPC